MQAFSLLTLFSRILLFVLCSVSAVALASGGHHHAETEAHHEEPKGPHQGRLLTDGDFTLELTLFERGIPPEFRVYATYKQQPVAPEHVELTMTLERLGDITDEITFTPQADYLRGNLTIYEPHSFRVRVTALHANQRYEWAFDTIEGRTHISQSMAQAMHIETGVAGPRTLEETVTVYGELTLPPHASRAIRARYAGLVTRLYVQYGDVVKKGQRLMSIESNESLQTYHLVAPIDGVVSEQFVGDGEQVNAQTLLVISDFSQLTAELAVFPSQQALMHMGANVELHIAGVQSPVHGTLADKRFVSGEAHTQQYRVFVDNRQRTLTVGQFVTAKVTTATYQVKLAVQADAIQPFRDFQVVYAKFGDVYEVRMLTLGRRIGDWVEVLDGLAVGTEYVTVNSYILKADVEKSGAAHDH